MNKRTSTTTIEYPRRRRPAVSRALLCVLASLCALAGSLVFAGAPALAASIHSFSTSFTGTGSSTLSEPTGVAVNNSTGDVYVVDAKRNLVEEFNATGSEVLREFNGASSPTGPLLEPYSGDIAVDNSGEPLTDESAGDVYVVDSGHGVVDKFNAAGVYLSQLTGDCPASTTCSASEMVPFETERIYGVAVGPTGTVWVYARIEGKTQVDSFTDSLVNEPIAARPALDGGIPHPGFAVDSKENLYVDHRNVHVVAKLNASGEVSPEGGEEFGGEEPTYGIAVEPTSNDLYFDRSGSVSKLAPNGTQLESFGKGHLTEIEEGSGISQGLAVNYSSGTASSGNVYVPDAEAKDVVVFTLAQVPETTSEPASSFTPTSATFTGMVNPEGIPVTGCDFEYGTEPGVYTTKLECAPPPPLTGNQPVSVSATATGLTQGDVYYYRLVASNANGAGNSVERSTVVPYPLKIDSESVTSVEETKATLAAQINPGGVAASYHFEYGLVAGAYEASVPVPAGKTPATSSDVNVSARVSGLKPGTTYHYRLVADNGLPPTAEGKDKVFTTPVPVGSEPPQNCKNEQLRAEQPYGLELPDCRAYEMVSPLEKNDNDAVKVSGGEVSARAAISGNSIVYNSHGIYGEPAGGYLEDDYLSRRGSSGWETVNISPPVEPGPGLEAASAGVPFGNMTFTPELEKGVVTHADVPLTRNVPAGFEELYLANLTDGTYQLVSQAPGTDEGLRDGRAYENPYQLEAVGASTDLSHIVYPEKRDSEDPSVDEWVDGRSIVVSVSNNGNVMRAAVGTGNSEGGSSTSSQANLWNAVSADGSRVYMTSPTGHQDGQGISGDVQRELYLRINTEAEQSPMENGKCSIPSDACTIQVSASQRHPGDPNAGSSSTFFWGASEDGSKVFFTSNAELTQDANTGPADNAPNLYEYDLDRPENERLKDLTVDQSEDGGSVLGVSQISENGAYVYFVAEGVLPSEKNNEGQAPIAGQANLYVSHEGKRPSFIATLENGSGHPPGVSTNKGIEGEFLQLFGYEKADRSDWLLGPALNQAAISGDGASFAFVSQRNLTSYDNEPAEPKACYDKISEENFAPGPCKEVYLYNADTQKLICASCDPSGARPLGPSKLNSAGVSRQTYRFNNLSANGDRLFFESQDALSPKDGNGRRDVYEYENEHVYPISDVSGNGESYFLDASQNGSDVFIATPDRLLPQDKDSLVDVYDARVEGGFPASASPSTCNNGDACKGPPSPQPGVFGSPASATFSGAGNLAPVVAAKPAVKPKAKPKPKQCKKGYVKKKGKCVKKAMKKAAKFSHKGRR